MKQYMGITGGRVLIDRHLESNRTLCYDGRWQGIETQTASSVDEGMFQAVLKLPEDYIVSPGFVDIHIHGMAGKDVMDGEEEHLAVMAETLVKTGVTSWLATTMTMGTAEIQKALRAASNFQMLQQIGSRPERGAKLEGVHLEGPYISPSFKGAQDPKHILPLDFRQFERDFYQIAPGLIKHVTCAAEEEGAEDFIKGLKQLNIHVALGHSGASYEQAKLAFEAGATHLTHFFNAMSPVHHREPGLAGAGMLLDFSTEWIADNIHIRPEWYSFLLELKGRRAALVTDAMCAAGLCPGHYSLGGQKVITDGQSARLENGVLAGSVLTMDQAVRNMAKVMPEKISQVLYAASTAPAELIGLKHIGAIEVGRSADFVILNGALEIQYVCIGGQMVVTPDEANQL